MAPATAQAQSTLHQYSIEEQFQACVDIIHSMPESGPAPTSYVARLAMYGLYKQITEGPCHSSKPGFWNQEGRAKWNAWNRLGEMGREEAMELYVTCVHEAIDVGAEILDWDELLSKYSDLYEEFSFLRDKFRIINRELIKEDGTRVNPLTRTILVGNSPMALAHGMALGGGGRTAGGWEASEGLQNGAALISFVSENELCISPLHSAPLLKSRPTHAVVSEVRKIITGQVDIEKIGPVPISLAEVFTMYALYKQATNGRCETTKPYWNIIERYKWDAWFRMGEMNKQQAMAGYVVGVLEKIDFLAENLDWDEMLDTYAEEYELLEPILREKFRIIDRELIKEDGTRVRPTPFHYRIVGVLSFNFDRAKQRKLTEGMGDYLFDQKMTIEGSPDEGYFDACEEYTMERTSSTLDDTEPSSVKSINSVLAKMNDELRTISAALNVLTKTSESRHQSITKLIKRSTHLSWRSIFFFIFWPFIINWAVKYFTRRSIV